MSLIRRRQFPLPKTPPLPVPVPAPHQRHHCCRDLVHLSQLSMPGFQDSSKHPEDKMAGREAILASTESNSSVQEGTRLKQPEIFQTSQSKSRARRGCKPGCLPQSALSLLIFWAPLAALPLRLYEDWLQLRVIARPRMTVAQCRWKIVSLPISRHGNNLSKASVASHGAWTTSHLSFTLPRMPFIPQGASWSKIAAELQPFHTHSCQQKEGGKEAAHTLSL